MTGSELTMNAVTEFSLDLNILATDHDIVKES
jgi:hypothetical protein